MPVMDGLEATKLIRSSKKLANTLVIAMTANVDQKDKPRCFDAGMNDFIAKPIGPNILVLTLLKWLKPSLIQVVPSDVKIEAPVTDKLIGLSVLAASIG